jgi:O-antigen ligase
MLLKKTEQFLFFLVLLTLPTQLGRHFWPDFSYVFSLRIDYLSPVLYLWDISVGLLILCWVFRKPKLNFLAINLLLFFLFTQLISLLGTSNIGPAAVRLEQYFVAGLFGVYIASLDFDLVKKKSLTPLLLSVIMESLLAIGQFFNKGTLGWWALGERSFTITTPAIAKFNYQGLEFLRPYGTFPHPNVMAAFLVISSPLLFLFKPAKSAWINLAIMISSLVCLLTVSRASILALLANYFFLFNKQVLALLFLVMIFISPVIFIRFSSLINFDNLSFERRQQQLVNAKEIIWEHIWLGVGLNNFIPFASSDLLVGPDRFLQPIHNIYLLEAVETGLVGLWGLVILLGTPIILVLASKTAKSKRLLLFGWLLILFLGVFDHYFLTLAQGYRLLFFFWGVSLSYLFSKVELKAGVS